MINHIYKLVETRNQEILQKVDLLNREVGECYKEIGEIIKEYSEERCDGRRFAVLEGGYNHNVLGINVRAFVEGFK